MITYIVYEESKEYPLESLLFLYEPFRNGGEIFMAERPEDPAKLPEVLNILPLKHITNEWRIIFLDCGQVYHCENPYQTYEEHFQYMEEFLKACSKTAVGTAERRITRFLPQQICLIALRSGLYFHTEEEGYLYSDFAGRHRSSYRYLIFDVGETEPALPEKLLFEVLCGVLTFAMNEWPAALLETGYLYRCRTETDEDKIAEYIGDMEETRRYINTLLCQEKQSGSVKGEYMDYVRDIPVTEEGKICAEGTKAFDTEGFPFAPEDNAAELSRFRMRNIGAIQRLRKLEQDPALRWEKRDDYETSVEPDKWEEFAGKRLTENGLLELERKKHLCAEAIFKEQLFEPELWKSLQRSRKLLSEMEERLRVRMTDRSFRVLVKEGIVGLAIIGAAYGALAVWSEGFMVWGALWGFLLVVMLFLTYLLSHERKRALSKLNRSLGRVDDSLKRADKVYGRMLSRGCVHQSYSALERQQQRLMETERERGRLLEEYGQMLLKGEGNIQQLSWLCGKQPVLREDIENRVFVDFSVSPKGELCFYMPDYKQAYDFVMKGAGARIRVPFPFITDFEIKKLYLPYSDREYSEGEEGLQ